MALATARENERSHTANRILEICLENAELALSKRMVRRPLLN